MQKLIEKYEKLRDDEDVRIVKGIYDGVVTDLQAELDKVMRAEARADFQKVLDELERAEKFSNSGAQQVCNMCGMPCVDKDYAWRRAMPNGSYRTICTDCLSETGK